MAQSNAGTGVLSDRQQQILACVADGSRDPETADHLDLTATTIRTYRRRAYVALGVHTAPAAVTELFRLGYLRPDGRWIPELSARQVQIIAAAARGKRGVQVAAELGITIATLKTHNQRIMNRLGAASAAHVVAICHHAGLLVALDPPGQGATDQHESGQADHEDGQQ